MKHKPAYTIILYLNKGQYIFQAKHFNNSSTAYEKECTQTNTADIYNKNIKI